MASHFVEGDELREPVWLALRAVLLEHWDPIEIGDDKDWPADEYDNYIPKIKALLRAGASVEILMDYPHSIASARMGFPSKRELARPAAALLLPLATQLTPLT